MNYIYTVIMISYDSQHIVRSYSTESSAIEACKQPVQHGKLVYIKNEFIQGTK